MEVFHFNSLYPMVFTHQSGLLYLLEQSAIHPTQPLHLKTHLKASGKQMLFSLTWHQGNSEILNILMQRHSQNSCRTLERLPKAASAEGTEAVPEAALWGCTDVSPADGNGMGCSNSPGWAAWNFLAGLPSDSWGRSIALQNIYQHWPECSSSLFWSYESPMKQRYPSHQGPVVLT